MVEKARMIHRRVDNIITYFRHRITNEIRQLKGSVGDVHCSWLL